MEKSIEHLACERRLQDTMDVLQEAILRIGDYERALIEISKSKDLISTQIAKGVLNKRSHPVHTRKKMSTRYGEKEIYTVKDLILDLLVEDFTLRVGKEGEDHCYWGRLMDEVSSIRYCPNADIDGPKEPAVPAIIIG